MWRARQQSTARPRQTPQAVAEVEYADLHEAEQECELFRRYTEGQPQQFTERFMTAASPGIVATAMGNAYYDSHDRFFFQAEDGIRDFHVTGVQTCALPI